MLETKEFLNPYNFISLPKQKAKAYEDTDKHTGVIEYSITTRSPLFIPNHSSVKNTNNNKDEMKCLDFFSYNDLKGAGLNPNKYYSPVIPGSELRGMIRSVYETLTDSCMGILNEDTYPTLRVGETFKAGLIKRISDKEYQLLEAKDYVYSKMYQELVNKKGWEEGRLVYFHEQINSKGRRFATEVALEKGNRKHAGYLIKGMPDGKIKRKCNCHIFKAIISSKAIELKSTDIDRLKAVLEAYQNEPGAEKAYKEYERELKKFIKGEGEEYFPVYKSIVAANGQQFIYLAPACFTKEVSKNSLKDLVGNFVPCKEKRGKCPTCDLFGMVGKNNEEAEGSKIRFADAMPEEMSDVKAYYDKEVVLEALGSPRLNNIEFYLKKPAGADFWNYDYYVKGGNVYPYKASIRGRKYYWHQMDVTFPKIKEPGKFNMEVRPVKKDILFTGKVYFDGITQKQLNQLLWILNGGNETEQPATGNIAYKLGAGKPLGLGSVELKVINCKERNICITEDELIYEVKEDKPIIPLYDEVEFSKTVKEEFFVISSLNATEGKLVSYPIVTSQVGTAMTEGFKWFGENHGGGKMQTKRCEQKRMKDLPNIIGVGTLPIWEETKKNPKPNYNKGGAGNKNFKGNSNKWK